MTDTTAPSRRHFLYRASALALAGSGLQFSARAAAPARSLAFDHTHTGEKIALEYAHGGRYDVQALASLNHFLRDHYSGDVGVIDPALLDLLHGIGRALDTAGSFQVISGYRAPATNSTLRRTRGGGVARHSLHMDGKAIDIRLPGVALADLRDAALSLQAGGVGFYPRSQFIHVDTGRVRQWQG